MPNTKLLLVSEYFWPDQASTGRLLGELFAGIKQCRPGWTVDILTSRHQYRGTTHEVLPRKEVWQGLVITRLPSLCSPRNGVFRRMVSDIVFSLCAAARLLVLRYDVVVVVTNPPVMPLLLTLLGRVKKVDLLYIVHDLYPDVPVAVGLWSADSVIARSVRMLQRYALTEARRIVVLGRCMRDHLVDAYQIPAEKIAVIPNWATLNVQNNLPERLRDVSTFRVVYAGNLGQCQDFETVLECAELLREQSAIRMLIAGDGPRARWLSDEVARRRLSNVTLLGFLPEQQFRGLLARTHLGLVTLEPNMEGLGVPSKAYNLLAFGVPLLAILGEHSEIAMIIEEHRLGYRVDHGDAVGMARSILEAFQHLDDWAKMSQRAIEYAQREAGPDTAAARYARVIELIAQLRSGNGRRAS